MPPSIYEYTYIKVSMKDHVDKVVNSTSTSYYLTSRLSSTMRQEAALSKGEGLPDHTELGILFGPKTAITISFRRTLIASAKSRRFIPLATNSL